MSKHNKETKRIKKIIIVILIIIFISSIAGIIFIKLKGLNDDNKQEEVSKALDSIDIDNSKITEEKTERMLQVEELKKQNNDIVGWIEIEGTNINYPVLQGKDNDYYLTHNYKNEEVAGGSIFLDMNYDFSIPSSNLLIYGHRNKKGLMFEDLINYKDENFYKAHPKIRFTTIADDSQYEIMSAFYSRVYYKNEENVFRYYYFINANNEAEYNEYVENCKNASIYKTGVIAKYGEQLLTLSTCEYSQDNGRFVVVAKKIE